jgi:hypothetical protein
MKRCTASRSTTGSTEAGPADRVHHGELTLASTLRLEIALALDSDELTDTEWSAFMGLSGPDSRR